MTQTPLSLTLSPQAGRGETPLSRRGGRGLGRGWGSFRFLSRLCHPSYVMLNKSVTLAKAGKSVSHVERPKSKRSESSRLSNASGLLDIRIRGDDLFRGPLARCPGKRGMIDSTVRPCSMALASGSGGELVNAAKCIRADNIGYANVRTDFSRSHWRVFAAAINASLSLLSTTPASCPTFAIFKSAWPPLSAAMALR